MRAEVAALASGFGFALTPTPDGTLGQVQEIEHFAYVLLEVGQPVVAALQQLGAHPGYRPAISRQSSTSSPLAITAK
jgi:hypothetical protein